MVKKRTPINLSQPIQPRGGELERLFATDGDVEQAAGLQLLAVRLDAIDPDPDQPRSVFNEDALRELSDSIRQDGVIQPIEVTQSSPGRYLIVHGERRWRAAQLAGLDTIPAVVRRRNYDEVTRFVRQVVENIQREDLNDVDRAAALLRLRKLMQEEVDATRRDRGAGGGEVKDEPWAGKVTWAKVGGRLGYSRQRIHQLIQLLDLPEEIKDAVRGGVLSERDTRVYQGLTAVQQRSLHRARMAGELSQADVRPIARLLREAPDMTVAAANAADGPTIVLSAGPRTRAADGWGRYWRNRLRGMGLDERPALLTLTPTTDQAALAAQLADAGAIFFTGNDAALMAELVAAMQAAGTDAALRDWWLGGGVLLADRAAAAAVGAAMSAEQTPTSDNVEYQSSDSFLADYVNIKPGLGLLPAVFEPRPLYDYLYGRMVSHVMAAPQTLVVGVERGAALRVTPDAVAVIGDEAALLLDGRYATTLAVGDNEAFAATWLLLDTFAPGGVLAE